MERGRWMLIIVLIITGRLWAWHKFTHLIFQTLLWVRYYNIAHKGAAMCLGPNTRTLGSRIPPQALWLHYLTSYQRCQWHLSVKSFFMDMPVGAYKLIPNHSMHVTQSLLGLQPLWTWNYFFIFIPENLPLKILEVEITASSYFYTWFPPFSKERCPHSGLSVCVYFNFNEYVFISHFLNAGLRNWSF